MAPGPAGDPGDADAWRARVEALSAALVALAFSLAAGAHRCLHRMRHMLRPVPPALGRAGRYAAPRMRAGARCTLAGVGRVVDAVARATTALVRAVPPVLVAAERVLVPALAAAGRGMVTGTAWTLDRIARGCPPVARASAKAAGVVVHTLAEATAAGARWVAPRLPAPARVARFALVTAAVAVGVGLAANPTLRLAASTVDLDDPAHGDAGFPPLDERSTVHAADGSVLAILHGEVDRRVVPLDQIPRHVRHAVITAEDRRFAEHGGYDLEAIARAFGANLRARQVAQGGSTITQQLAKQNYVGDERVLTRKVNEVIHAVALEGAFSKDELMERYLNQVYFGAGAYGIAAAAEDFFAVAPEQLTVEQAALLAGMIRSPNALNPRTNPAGAQQRRDQVLAGMVEEGYLDAAEAEEARGRPVEVVEQRTREPVEPHVVEAVKREFLTDPAFGDTREERARRLFAGGLTISTTIDPRLQAAATESVNTHIRPEAGPTASIAVVDPVSGKVRALHSGTDFAGEQFDVATQGRRQPGSALKPLVLAAALERGSGMPRSLRGDSPATFSVTGDAERWRVTNYRGRDYGSVGGHEALVRSVNTAFADLILDVGIDPVIELSERLGIDVEAAFGPENTRGPSIALGGLTRGVSPLEMASVYAAFANDGIHVRPYLIERVAEADGSEVLARRPEAAQVIDETANELLVEAMQDVVRHGTGTRARLSGWEPIGKTGTTQDSADAWFVGAVPGLSAAVWVGHPDERTPIHGLTGGSLPAPIWRDFMRSALQEVRPVAFGASDR